MNIFYLSSNPNECAQWHVDKHVTKMSIEYAQLLSTAHRVLDGTPHIITTPRKKTVWALADDRETTLYKATHVNHPSCLWTRQSDANYRWLLNLWNSLLTEYTYRYGKVHGCAKLLPALSQVPCRISTATFTDPPPAMPDVCKRDTAIASYQEYYRTYKRSFASWKNRTMPAFMLL
jgi:hypothetical protein